MKIIKTKCDDCIFEEIKADIPDYHLEPWGTMPIWGKYHDKSLEKYCVVCYDNEGASTLCFEHLLRRTFEEQ